MVLPIIVFIFILGLLIFVHELGHFVTARRNGIKAGEFGFGFPPRIFGFIRDEKTGKLKLVRGNKEIESENTVYSVNWIPLGGFVRIKGEDGSQKSDPDSFSGKSAWVRIKVLAAGVTMNFLLAWVIISVGLMIGDPEPIDASAKSSKESIIQVVEVSDNSPASMMGLKTGDVILKDQVGQGGEKINFKNTADVQNFISSQKGKEITLAVKRGDQVIETKGTPRVDVPAGQGSLGISFQDSVMVKYPWYMALWKGLEYTWNLTIFMLVTLGSILKGLLFGQAAGIEVSGPVGIAVLTKQATQLGLIYILHLAAILSINLGIINILPIPALDGGRILFVLIEKIKGSPVNQKVEQAFHTAFFALLILLMVFVTYRDVLKFIVK